MTPNVGSDNISKHIFDIPNEVDYVIIELVHEEDVKKRKEDDKLDVDLERGLFIGFEVRDSCMFICTTTNGKDLLLYNADHYNISMLEYGDDLLKHIYVYTDTPNDQEEAIDTLGKLLEKFQNKNKVLKDKNLIDISEIKNYGIDKTVFETTSDVNQGEESMGRRKTPNNFTPDQYDQWEDYMYHGGATEGYNPACGYTGRSYTPAPTKPKAVLFKRNSSKPGKKKLNTMKESVKKVVENKGYEIKAKTKEGNEAEADAVIGEAVGDCYNRAPI